ncbi:MAG: hypothetical protein EOM23_11465 [Candidatus Moranbacteria bacterium]|nr:hypothetical protein [Candidatus Moranbacteria bacterium]
MNKDPYFTFAQINQYTLFSSVQSQSTEHYLYQKAVEMLKEVKDFKDLFIQHMLLTYLTGVALEGYSKDDVIDHKIRSSNFFFQRINEITYMVIHELILYHYRLKEVEIAYQIYERVKKIKGKLDPKLITYMLKKTAHQIHLEDHDAYLKEHQNVYIGDYWVFEPVIDPYAKMDDSHKVLPFILYQSEVDFEETESNE